MVSVCILAKNEEKLIGDCLESVKEIASEIIVINNGSTDRTKEIALDFGCIVIDSPDTVIDQGRNLYMENAKYPWILVMDADERLDKNAITPIKEFIKNISDDVLGINLNNYQYTGNGMWSNLKLIRLIRNNSKLRYQDTPIHADIETSIKVNNGIIADCNASVHHIDILVNGRTKYKRERYKNHLINILRTDNIKSKRAKGYLYCFLGLEYSALNDFETAEDLYKMVINENKECRDFAKVFLAQNYLLKNDIHNASRVINSVDSSQVSGINDQILYVKLEVLYRQNKIQESINLINENLELNKEAHNYVNLAILYQDEFPFKAIECIEKATKINDYLNKSLIYQEGEKPNIFFQQSCILNSPKNIMKIMEECCIQVGDIERFNNWIDKEFNLA
ncbi:MAG: tetratricopeptide repeat-containing glycosyltransferase family 2 protein [Paraclostridium sp.]